jgi:hypothetical protein
MSKKDPAIDDKLISYVQEIYETCDSPQKSKKCLCFDDPYDLPCQNERMINVREQINAIKNRKPYKKQS